MKGIFAGAIISTITALFAVVPGAAAEGLVKAEDSVALEIGSYLDTLVAENKLSGAVLVAKDGVTIASKAAGIANTATGRADRVEYQVQPWFDEQDVYGCCYRAARASRAPFL